MKFVLGLYSIFTIIMQFVSFFIDIDLLVDINIILWIALASVCIILIFNKGNYLLLRFVSLIMCLVSVFFVLLNEFKLLKFNPGEIQQTEQESSGTAGDLSTDENEIEEGFIDYCDIDAEFVLHAGGGIDGIEYLNCQEAFLESVQEGFSVLELDFMRSADGEIFCEHFFEHYGDYSYENRPTIEQVKNMKLYDKYTPIVLDWLFEKLVEYPNVKIVFDTKDDADLVLDKIVSDAETFGIDITDKFIIQVYSVENYENAKLYNFVEYWFTNYKACYSAQDLMIFEDIENITTLVLYYDEWLNFDVGGLQTNKNIAVYTVNDKSKWKVLEAGGVEYIFIDFY